MVRATIGYGRISTANQLQGYSLAAQEQRIRQYCMAYGYDLEQVYCEQQSGSEKNRPVLDEIIDRVKAGEIDKLVIVKLDRIARNLKNMLELIDLLEQHGVKLISIEEQIDSSTSTGKLFQQIMGALSEFERNLIKERLISGKHMKGKQNKGFLGGRCPYGYSTNDKQLIVNEVTAETVRKIYQWYSRDYSMKWIAERLNELQIGSPSNKKWNSSTILSILTNEVYTGKMKHLDIVQEVESIISVRMWNTVQRKRMAKSKKA